MKLKCPNVLSTTLILKVPLNLKYRFAESYVRNCTTTFIIGDVIRNDLIRCAAQSKLRGATSSDVTTWLSLDFGTDKSC
jgi:hypothetical protein